MQEYPPPYYTAGDPVRLFYREGRRDVRWTAMGLGFLVLMVLALLQYLPQAMVSLLPMMGYDSAGRFFGFRRHRTELIFSDQLRRNRGQHDPGRAFCIWPYSGYRCRGYCPAAGSIPLFFLSLFFIGVALTLAANIPNNWFYQWIESMVPIPSNPSGNSSAGEAGEAPSPRWDLCCILYAVRLYRCFLKNSSSGGYCWGSSDGSGMALRYSRRLYCRDVPRKPAADFICIPGGIGFRIYGGKDGQYLAGDMRPFCEQRDRDLTDLPCPFSWIRGRSTPYARGSSLWYSDGGTGGDLPAGAADKIFPSAHGSTSVTRCGYAWGDFSRV